MRREPFGLDRRVSNSEELECPMSPKENCDTDLLESVIEEIDFSSIEIGISVADRECKGFDPYDTASLYVKKIADQN